MDGGKLPGLLGIFLVDRFRGPPVTIAKRESADRTAWIKCKKFMSMTSTVDACTLRVGTWVKDSVVKT